MISHAWGENFGELISGLEEIAKIEKLNDDELTVWICCFALYQNKEEGGILNDTTPGAATIPSQIGNTMEEAPFYKMLMQSEKMYCFISSGGLKYGTKDHESGNIFNRMWCVFEMFVASNLCRANKDGNQKLIKYRKKYVIAGNRKSDNKYERHLHDRIADRDKEKVKIRDVWNNVRETTTYVEVEEVEVDKANVSGLLKQRTEKEGTEIYYAEINIPIRIISPSIDKHSKLKLTEENKKYLQEAFSEPIESINAGCGENDRVRKKIWMKKLRKK